MTRKSWEPTFLHIQPTIGWKPNTKKIRLVTVSIKMTTRIRAHGRLTEIDYG